MQRELDPAAEAGAVDRRDGREPQVTQSAEQLVPGARSLDCTLARDVRKLGDVRTCGEEERLACDDRRAEVAVFELRERTVE